MASSGRAAMETEKNLQATIPAALLARVQDAARAEHITVDELVRYALQRRLNTHEWRETLAFGEKHAESLGLREPGVTEAIAEPGVPVERARRGAERSVGNA